MVYRRSRPSRRTGKRSTYFIAGAIQHPGSLRDWVQATYGMEGFDSKGRIRRDLLRKIAARKCPVCEKDVCVCPSRTVQKRAVLAETLARIRERRR